MVEIRRNHSFIENEVTVLQEDLRAKDEEIQHCQDIEKENRAELKEVHDLLEKVKKWMDSGFYEKNQQIQSQMTQLHEEKSARKEAEQKTEELKEEFSILQGELTTLKDEQRKYV